MKVELVQSYYFTNVWSINSLEEKDPNGRNLSLRIFRDTWDIMGRDSENHARTWAEKEGHEIAEVVRQDRPSQSLKGPSHEEVV